MDFESPIGFENYKLKFSYDFRWNLFFNINIINNPSIAVKFVILKKLFDEGILKKD